MSNTDPTNPTPSKDEILRQAGEANTTPTDTAPQPMSWEEQKALYGKLVQKTERTEDDQDFLEAVGMAFVLDDLFSEEEPPSDSPPTHSTNPPSNSTATESLTPQNPPHRP